MSVLCYGERTRTMRITMKSLLLTALSGMMSFSLVGCNSNLKTENELLKKENEELLISNLEEKETLEKNINKNEASLEELKTDLDVRRNKLDEALSETADEKAALENSRKKQVTEIDDNTMQVYNKVISARSGIAVVPLSGNSCGGCGAALPLQMVSEIRAGDLHNCQSCGRFVYNKKN